MDDVTVVHLLTQMAKLKLRGKDLRAIGYPEGPVISIAMNVMGKNYKFESEDVVMNLLKQILASPVEYANDTVLGLIAQQLIPKPTMEGVEISLNKTGIHFQRLRKDNIEEGAMNQMYQATKLPIAVAGALMPDAHTGYGLADRRGIGHRKCGHPLWRWCRYRLPDVSVGF